MTKVKVVSCRDAGYDCDFVARSESEDDLLNQVAQHAKAVHNMTEITDEVVQKVRSLIHEEETVR